MDPKHNSVCKRKEACLLSHPHPVTGETAKIEFTLYTIICYDCATVMYVTNQDKTNPWGIFTLYHQKPLMMRNNESFREETGNIPPF